jgi:hypothetical protein
MQTTKARFYYIGKKESAACFWVAACKAFYGDFYAITYWELKINILDLMRRYMDLHPTNKWKSMP